MVQGTFVVVLTSVIYVENESNFLEYFLYRYDLKRRSYLRLDVDVDASDEV